MCPIVLFLILYSTSVLCTEQNLSDVYYEFINNVVNTEELTARIKAKLGDTEEDNLALLKMVDAWTKFPSGLLEGNLIDLGNFDECYGIRYKDLYGKYCLGSLPLNPMTEKYFDLFGRNITRSHPTFMLHPQPRLAMMSDGNLGIRFAACVPSNMAATEIPSILQYSEDMCYSKATEKELSAGAIATITVLSIFLCLVVLSTTYDIVMFYAKKEVHHELFIAFSFLSNGRKLFRITKNPDQLLCLNGIRAISVMWVILGHEFLNILGAGAPISNMFYVQEWQNNAANMYITGATVSVDTFFVVGGLVTVYTFLRSMDKGVKFNVLLYYVHRYLRLTPAFFIVGLIHLFLIEHLGNGPAWKYVEVSLVESCREGWWSSFLYITNYVQEGVCVPQAWYLSVDMQLYIMSPIVLITLFKSPKIGLGLLGVLTIAGCAVPFAVGYINNLGQMTDLTNVEGFTNLYYFQTYTRFGPYVIGIILGYFIYKLKKSELKVHLNWWMVISLWLVFLTALVACVYAGYPLYVSTEEDRWGNSLFFAFNRPAWAVAVAGVIFLCVAGYGGPIDVFLSLPVFQFLTKLSYSMYLVHYSIITIRYASMKNTFKISNGALMHAFWGDFMFTLALSLILCLTFESPIIILEKYLFGKRSSNKPMVAKKAEA